MRPVWPVLLVLLVLLPTMAAAETEQLGLMIPDVGATGGIEAKDVESVTELLLARFQEVGHYKVFGSADLVDILKAEERKQLLGCAEDTCLTQIGGALGVSLIAKASVGKLGDTFLFNLKVLNVDTAEVESRCVKEIQGEVDAVLPAVRECIEEVTGDLDDRYQFGVRVVAEGKIGPLALYITGGAAVAAGITTLALDFATGAQADALSDDPSDEDARDRGKSLQTAERVFLGVTVAGVVAAGVLALFTDFGGEPVTVAPVVGGDATGVAVVGRF